MSNIAIQVKGVGKKFCKNLNRSMLYGAMDIIKNTFGVMPDSSFLRRDEFWAVNDVSFELKRGETVGIIGSNGSGKTTLLKMLNGIFMPDKGEIRVNGKVGALIQVGAGFHPMLSGRENIYVNGAILGMSKWEIKQKLDSIIEFADIGDFLDSPVKYYSSGMYVRLGFAIAIHCAPDILLIDEILAVGDIKFQSKCFSYMTKNVLQQGCAVVFVSHNRYAVQDLCDRVVYLNRGEMRAVGPALQVIGRYLTDIQREESNRHQSVFSSFGGENIEGITKVLFVNAQGEFKNEFRSGEKVCIRFYYSFLTMVNRPSVGITFVHADPRYSLVSSTDYIFNLHSGYDELNVETLTGEGYFEVTIDALYMPVGSYRYLIYLFAENKMNLIQKNENAGVIEILRLDHSSERSLIELPHRWDIRRGDGLS
jgi:lipopolysaccharide transport system ATP-binding protein